MFRWLIRYWWLVGLGVVAVLLWVKTTRAFLLSLVSRLQGFANEVTEEMKKVSWPSRTELKNSTGLVILSMIALTVFVSVIDFVLHTIIGLVL